MRIAEIEKLTNKLLKTPKARWKSIIEKKSFDCDTEQNSKGKHAEILIGSKQNFEHKIALKVEYIRDPKDENDKCYRELLIFKVLSSLRCPGFIQLYDWFKSVGDHEDDSDDSDSDDGEYMNLVLERADETLNDFILRHQYIISLECYKTILFQILFALHYAQTACEFVHNDLHLKNILLVSLPPGKSIIAFHDRGNCWISRQSFMIKITDFGMSRIKLPSGKIIYNTKNLCHGNFDPYRDCEQLARDFDRIRINWKQLDKEESEKEKANLRNLKSLMKKRSTTPGQILTHEFFNSLRVQSIEGNKQVLHVGQERSLRSNDKENFDPVNKKVIKLTPPERKRAKKVGLSFRTEKIEKQNKSRFKVRRKKTA